jgi:hypothetical protein
MMTGKKYLIHYRIPGRHRVPRTMVAKFLGDVGKGKMSFSGRPEFGTTELDEKWIDQVKPVDSATKCHADRKWR